MIDIFYELFTKDMGFNITIIHKKGIIERVMKKTIMRKYFITSKMQPGGLHFFVISQRRERSL